MTTALVLYIEPLPSTVLFRAPRERIGARTVLATLFERCALELGAIVDEYIVLSHTFSDDSWRVGEAIRHPAVSYVEVEAEGIVSAVVQLFKRNPHLTTVLLFPEGTVFPDCQRTRALLESHHHMAAGMTFSPDAPAGLLPLAITPERTPRLDRQLAHSRSCLHLFALLFDLAKRPGERPPAWLHLFQPADLTDAILGDLPESALIADRCSLRAAQRVDTRYRIALPSDHGPAVALKTELLGERQYEITARRLPEESAKRVLFSSLQPAFSGGEESLYQLIANLTPERYLPVVCFPGSTLLAQKLGQRGMAVEISDRTRHTLTAGNLRYYEDLLDAVRPSLVHVDGYTNPALMAAACLRHIPIVSHVRMILPPHLQPELAMADGIVAISEAVATTLRRRNILPAMVRTIYNGVDLTRFVPSCDMRERERAALGLAPTDRVVVLVGRITPNKRHHLLIDALSVLRERADNIHVLMVGDVYDQQYFHQLGEAARRYGVESKVHWLGFRSNIAEVYAASDVMTLCTRNEPFGRCIIEAMAMGVPCVVPDKGGPPEIVKPGSGGVLFDADNPRTLASALGSVLFDDTLRIELGRTARVRAQDFDTRKHVERIEALYDELIANGTGVPC